MPNQTNNNVFLDGGSFCLRPLRLEDAKGNYGRWFNDREVVQYMIHGSFPMGEAELETFIRHTHTTRNDLILAVVDKEKQQHVGNIGLHRIDWIRRSAEFGIVIGEKEYWGMNVSSSASPIGKLP
jgi:RimJ/RimL family protein N-acetyltransferase